MNVCMIMRRPEANILKKGNIEVTAILIMSFEEELEAIEREEWLENFEDPQILWVTKIYLDWLYQLPEGWQPKGYIKFKIYK